MAFLTHSQKPNSKQRTACSELTVVFAVKLTNPKPHFCFFSSLCGKLNSEPAALWQSFQLYHFFLLIVVSLRSHLFLVSAAIRNLTTVANLARSCFMVIAPKLPCHLQILLIGFLNVYFLDVVWTHYITLRHSPGEAPLYCCFKWTDEKSFWISFTDTCLTRWFLAIVGFCCVITETKAFLNLDDLI